MAGRKKKEPDSNVKELIAALEFIKVAQADKGEIYQQHCHFVPGFLMAANGVLQAGIAIKDELEACPHTLRLLSALTKAKETVSITKLDTNRLSIVSGPFRALVDCADSAALMPIMPDMPAASLDEKLRTALEIVGLCVQEGASRVIAASVWFTNGSCIGCDGKLILEYWHGLSLPPVLIPKASVNAILKVGKKFKSIGASERSVTFWFEDDSWIKTQTYDELAPDQNKVFNLTTNPIPLPEKIYDGIEAVTAFAEENIIYLTPGKVQSHRSDKIGAVYEVPQITNNCSINASYMLMVKPFIKQIDLSNSRQGISIFGDNLRGIMAGMTDDATDETPKLT